MRTNSLRTPIDRRTFIELAALGGVHVDTIGNRSLGSQDPMTRDTIFRIASMTKPITAVAAMILVEESVFRLEDSVERFLPELANRRVLNGQHTLSGARHRARRIRNALVQ